LRALKKEQEKQEQTQEDSPPSDTGTQGNNQEQGKQSSDEQPPPGDGDQDKEESQEKDTPQKSEDQAPGQKEKAQPKNKDRQTSSQNKPPDSKEEKIPSGNLKSREAMSELEETNPLEGNSPADIDKKKAEALLDNVQEDPSAIMQFMVSEEKRQNSFSGRDW